MDMTLHSSQPTLQHNASSRFGRVTRSVAVVVMLAALLPGMPVQASLTDDQRTYQAAKRALAEGERSTYKRLAAQLDSYVLAPYLDYHEHRSRLSALSPAQIEAFAARWPDTDLPRRLKDSWLLRQGRRGNFETYLAHYQPSTSAERQCLYLRALYRSGARDEALSQVTPLWLAPKSQPKICDPLFDAWINDGRLTENTVWQRLKLSLGARETGLARYLLKLFESSDRRAAAQLFYNVHRRPDLLARTERLAESSADHRDIIAHGLTRLAASDALQAERLWSRYRQLQAFDDATVERIEMRLRPELAKLNRFPTDPTALPSAAIAGVANEAVEAANWPEVIRHIEALELRERAQPRWQYWLARALEATTGGDSARAQLMYRALADERHYYGFMAADRVREPFKLNAQSSSADRKLLSSLRAAPEVTRAVELYAVNERTNARREWNRFVYALEGPAKLAAGHLAIELGWTDKAIRTANAAGAHNDLALRFPTPHLNTYQDASIRSDIPLAMLLGVTRQESAFDHRARSSANARGLMQMLHSTARIAARRAKLPSPSVTDLYKPKTNITLAASHLAFLMDRYDRQRPLVFAAYNAGEHRVDRWIAEQKGAAMDVWIERIPFYETRNYVKNVLAFNVVYGELTEQTMPVLFEFERNIGQGASSTLADAR